MIKRRSSRLLLLSLAPLAALPCVLAGPAPPAVGPFSQSAPGGQLPAGWQPLAFKTIEKPTRYALVTDGGATVVMAESRGGASGLLRKVEVDLRQFPILRWRWKVQNLIQKCDPRQKAGDDCPARVYLMFAYDPASEAFWERTKFETARVVQGEYPPGAAINYIWATAGSAGDFITSPYTDRSRMVVVECGAARVGQWVEEKRDVLADFRRAFGRDPPPLAGIAIMTDTDNTGESAVAFYGDLAFEAASSGAVVVAEALAAADVLEAQGHFEEAVAAYLAVPAGSESAVLWRLARAHADWGDLVAGGTPAGASGAREAARLARREALYDRAVECARRAVSTAPRESNSHASLAMALGKKALLAGGQSKIDLAKAVSDEAETALALDPSNVVPYVVLGIWNREVAALNFLERAAARLLYGGLGTASNERSLEFLKKAVELRPDLAKTHYELALTYRALDEEDKACAELERALPLCVESPIGERLRRDVRAALEACPHAK